MTQSTGTYLRLDANVRDSRRIVPVVLGDYFTIVELDENGKFIRIREIGMKRDFLSQEQRMQRRDLQDIEHLFEEE